MRLKLFSRQYSCTKMTKKGAEMCATRRVLGFRTRERSPSRWLTMSRIGSNPPNKQPRTINGMVSFRLVSDFPKKPRKPAGGTMTWRMWPDYQMSQLSLVPH